MCRAACLSRSAGIVKAWMKLQTKPDVLVLDGHGIAHPRRMGIATHFGIVMHTATFGCAKSLLTGKYEEPSNEPGTSTDLIHKNEMIGKVLRTKKEYETCVYIARQPHHYGAKPSYSFFNV